MTVHHCPTDLWEENVLNLLLFNRKMRKMNKWLLNKINYCTKKGLVIYLFVCINSSTKIQPNHLSIPNALHI